MQLRWGDITATVSGSLTLTPGVDPDVFTISLPGNLGLIPTQADLSIGAENGTVVLRNCRASVLTVPKTATDATCSLQVRDRRCFWSKSGTIDGEYNERDVNDDIIDDAERKSARELAGMLLDALGETGYDVSAFSSDEYPYVFWDASAPAAELDDLAGRYSIHVCLGWDDVVRCHKEGSTDPEPADPKIESTVEETIIDTPQIIRVVGGRNRYELEIELEAVGYDPTDDTWKALDGPTPPSWKPTGGWYVGFEDHVDDADSMKAARDTAFRCYRLPETLSVRRQDGSFRTASRRELGRYWTDQLLEQDEQDNAKRYKQAYCYGKHATESAVADPLGFIDDEETIIDVPFTLDNDRGLVVFDERIYSTDVSSNLSAPTITIKSTHHLDRYIEEYETGSPRAVDGMIDSIVRDDVYMSIRGTKTGGYTTISDPSATTAAAYAKEHLDSYPDAVDGAKSAVFPGIKQISPDGLIRQVTWSATPSGPTTTVSWGARHRYDIDDEHLRRRDRGLSGQDKKRRNRSNSNIRITVQLPAAYRGRSMVI